MLQVTTSFLRSAFRFCGLDSFNRSRDPFLQDEAEMDHNEAEAMPRLIQVSDL